jgi:NADH-quinone oxidoreductase subunit J
MNIVFYISAAIAVFSTLMVITRYNAVHALLYLILSFFSISVIFLVLGAPFAAALEIIIYAGAIMVLFVFVIIMLNLGPRAQEQESHWLNPTIWIGPSVLAVILISELIYIVAVIGAASPAGSEVTPKQVGIALFGPYVLGVELASMLLLAGLVGAYHLGRRIEPVATTEEKS